MLRKVSTVAVLAGVFTLGAVYSAHASTTSGAAPIRGMAADSVTGCLQKGNRKDMYSVTDASGKKHWVSSTSVPLDKHVGHTVTLTGTTAANDNKMTTDTGMKMSGDKMTMTGPMTVTALSMVSPTCK
jgi:hypothetical protein